MKACSRPRPIWPYLLLIFCAWIALAIFAAPARAQTICTGLADVLAGLRATYGETIMWVGVAENGQRLVLTANADGSTWTALTQSSAASDQLCFVGTGVTWNAGDGTFPPSGSEG